MSYDFVGIKKIVKHNPSLRTFYVDIEHNPRAGQFCMVWLPGVDEKPFSYSGLNRITVRRVGAFTEELFKKDSGDRLHVRGPYGQGFPEGLSRVALIGGGVGIAPLACLLHSHYQAENIAGIVLAGKNESELIFLDDIVKSFGKVTAVTEDGSYGVEGISTDVDFPEADAYFVCGPEIMMKSVADKLVSDGVDSRRIYLCLERYMKCAVGICGNCSLSGYRVCADGPVLSYDKIKDAFDFNKLRRSRTGELSHIKIENIEEKTG